MSEIDEEADMTVHAQSELHKTKWLGPSGHLHSSSSFLNDFEIAQLSKLLTRKEISGRLRTSLKALKSKDKQIRLNRERISDIAGEVGGIYAHNYIDLKAAKGGFRSSQFTKVSSSVRSGVTPIIEKKSGWGKLKFWGKKKEESK